MLKLRKFGYYVLEEKMYLLEQKNVFLRLFKKWRKIEKMLKLRKFAYYVSEEQCKNKENIFGGAKNMF